MAKRYRKKPVEVEAVQVPKLRLGESTMRYVDRAIALADWCGGKSYMMANDGEKAYEASEVVGPHILIPTLEGNMAARPGDIIIRGVNGEFYPCKPDIFAKTYEPVLESVAA